MGRNNSSKGGGKIELSINLKSLKIKVFLTLFVVPDVTFSIPAMSAGEAFRYFWIFFKKEMGILQLILSCPSSSVVLSFCSEGLIVLGLV